MKWSSFCLLCMVVCMLNACSEIIKPHDYQRNFSCKVNGQLWVPADDEALFFATPTFSVVHVKFSDSIDFSARRVPTGETITLRNVGLKLNAYTEIKYMDVYSRGSCSTYVPDTTKLNYIKTTSIDTIHKMISGIFQVECNSVNCLHNIKITEGRFAITY